MKKVAKIVIDLKDTRKMCSDKKRLSEGCVTCLSEIQDSVSSFLDDIADKDTKQRARMSDEWAIFLSTAENKLDTSIQHSEKEADQRNTNSRWILAIVLGVTFALGAVVGFTWERLGTKADRKEVVTLEEMKMMHELTQAYNADQFLRNPYAKIDTTNFNWLVKKIFSGTMRGGTK